MRFLHDKIERFDWISCTAVTAFFYFSIPFQGHFGVHAVVEIKMVHDEG